MNATSKENANPADRDVGVVVNFYSNLSDTDKTQIIITTTVLSLQLIKLSPVVNTVLLVDGSNNPNPELERKCSQIGVDYYHHGSEISYVDAYNLGWNKLDEPYIALMANDIIPHPVNCFEKLREYIKADNIGCVFPYFSSNRNAGDETQQLGFYGRGHITCEPATMTLNLNLFKREVLEKIGGLNPRFLSSYAEPILLIAIRNLNYRVVMVGNTRVIHYDQLTKGLGQSNINQTLHDDDTARWFAEFPDYASRLGFSSINIAKRPFSTRLTMRILYRLASLFPIKSLRRPIYSLCIWMEPFFTKYKP